MKKGIFIFLCLILLAGCTKQLDNTTNSIIDNEPVEVIDEVDDYVDDNPITVGLYLNGKLIDEYNTTFINGKDIAVFDAYFTNEADVGSTNTKRNFNRYYGMYDNIDDYKIGYFVSFDTSERHYEKVIVNPDVEYALSPYIYLYLYDDIHQADGAWYSHVTMNDFNDDTIFSCIKLYMAGYSEQITSPITLMVFTYDDEEDFDSDGNYRGKSSYTITINNH